MRLRSLIVAGLADSDPKVRKKYAWLRDHFHPHLQAIRAALDSADINEDLRTAYRSIEEIPTAQMTVLRGVVRRIRRLTHRLLRSQHDA